jgi:hypothetical protein
VVVNVTATILTSVACLAAAVVILLAMLLAMNGYHESDATWGLGLFALLALMISAAMGAAASYAASFLIRKGWHPALAALFASIACFVAGVGLEILSSIAGVGVAEIVRLNF